MAAENGEELTVSHPFFTSSPFAGEFIDPTRCRKCLRVGITLLDDAVTRQLHNIVIEFLLINREDVTVAVQKHKQRQDRSPLVAVIERVVMDERVQQGCSRHSNRRVFHFLAERSCGARKCRLEIRTTITAAGRVYRIAAVAEIIDQHMVNFLDNIGGEVTYRVIFLSNDKRAIPHVRAFGVKEGRNQLRDGGHCHRLGDRCRCTISRGSVQPQEDTDTRLVFLAHLHVRVTYSDARLLQAADSLFGAQPCLLGQPTYSSATAHHSLPITTSSWQPLIA